MLKSFFVTCLLLLPSVHSLAQLPDRMSLRSKEMGVTPKSYQEDMSDKTSERTSNDWWRSSLFCVTPMNIVVFTSIGFVISVPIIAIYTADYLKAAQHETQAHPLTN
jgi:hypothetical protein